MALFRTGKRKSTAQAVGGERAHQASPDQAGAGTSAAVTEPKITLPPPLMITSREDAGHALDQVGDLQRYFETGDITDSELRELGNAVSSRVQGVVDYFVSLGMEINLYSQVVEPISAWAIGNLAPMWIMDQGATPRTAAAKHSYFVIAELMTKYARLKPS